uniref:Uncharacterized protein n=1 Tax=Candidatus Kentrum sp. SD TaxID=2126332 RepID=A0A450Z123_9GAMM|nr:MAG: hypothetical protein BECKSD772F_GA0070984_10994 [Candidatus Kentron sp. SD]VFK47491.1 MAG: hypothetical protein BECKSD772E_GA0070983_10963 [Candidatus Kentron sp. SD]VFK80187.1 MAG: hypothetical protein BECKSD772D_GA0070982_10917 [Candidatus Kentron sp. SD]
MPKFRLSRLFRQVALCARSWRKSPVLSVFFMAAGGNGLCAAMYSTRAGMTRGLLLSLSLSPLSLPSHGLHLTPISSHALFRPLSSPAPLLPEASFIFRPDSLLDLVGRCPRQTPSRFLARLHLGPMNHNPSVVKTSARARDLPPIGPGAKRRHARRVGCRMEDFPLRSK